MGLLLLQIFAGACTGYLAVVPQEQQIEMDTKFPMFLTEPQTKFDHQVKWVAMLLSILIDTTLAYQYGYLVVVNANLHNVDPLLMAGVMMQESRGDSMAISSGNAVGLMQIIPSIWHLPDCDTLGVYIPPRTRAEHVTNLHLPKVNICYGAHILSFYLNQQRGNVRRALARYSGYAKLYPTKVLSYVGQAYMLSTQREEYYE